VSQDRVWMTVGAYERLQAELEALTAAGATADDAALSRAVELRDLLSRAQTGQMPDDGLVEPGMLVTVRFDDDASELTFVLGDRVLLTLDDSLDVPVYSPSSPLGAAINGINVGDQTVFSAPRGDRRLTVIEARPVS
jgi:transcription elongation factor GreA